MCGICGFIAEGNLSFDHILQDMSESMKHRGPDDQGIFIDTLRNKTIGLAHQRLSIIDLSRKSRQPMLDDAGEVALIFNGEIYNYIELRTELQRKGYDFISTGDSEVILCAYKEWGVGAFKRFNGMWAIALLDRKRQKLILSRDRFGKKPLYYYKNGTDFIFASEIKALFRYPKVPREPNYEKVYRYITKSYRYVDIDDYSFFKGITQVPKGSLMTVDMNQRSSIRKYWSLNTAVNENITEDDAVEGFRELFIDAVKIRLRSDVKVGVMLSGGMDSTSIASTAAKLLNGNVEAFSGISKETISKFDESEYINAVVEDTKIHHHYVRPDIPSFFETLDEMLSFHDEPICTDTWYMMYLINKKIKESGFKVILNGHGGDEILAGYYPGFYQNFYDLFEAGRIQDLLDEIQAFSSIHGKNTDEIGKYIAFIAQTKQDKSLEMKRFKDYRNVVNEDIRERYEKKIVFRSPYADNLSNRLYIELFYDAVPPLLRAEDRTTMTHSIESRLPFLDYRLAEFCFSLPNSFKIRNGTNKWILRESMKGILTEKVRERKDKLGFITPADEWFRAMSSDIRALFNSNAFKGRGLFDIKEINKMFDEHLGNTENHQMLIWQLLNLELWFKKYFE
ncbi:MAG: asparagine synthase (glutamine-hydrolyzing) [Nitrospirota bacterium]